MSHYPKYLRFAGEDDEAVMRDMFYTALKGQVNFMTWRYWRSIADVFLGCDGILFGGYPRDAARRKMAADAFYTRFTDGSYNDPEVDPQSFEERTVLPRDLDVYLPDYASGDFTTITGFLKHAGFEIADPGTLVDEKYIFDSPLKDHLSHYKMKVKLPQTVYSMLDAFVGKEEYKIRLFTIDIITPKKGSSEGGQLLPPFGPCDFRCNSLLVSRRGCSTFERFGKPFLAKAFDSMTTEESVTVVLDDIRRKKAVMCHFLVPQHRIEKMDKLEWTKSMADGERVVGIKGVRQTPRKCCFCSHPATAPDDDFPMTKSLCGCKKTVFHFACFSQAATPRGFVVCPDCGVRVVPWCK